MKFTEILISAENGPLIFILSYCGLLDIIKNLNFVCLHFHRTVDFLFQRKFFKNYDFYLSNSTLKVLFGMDSCVSESFCYKIFEILDLETTKKLYMKKMSKVFERGGRPECCDYDIFYFLAHKGYFSCFKLLKNRLGSEFILKNTKIEERALEICSIRGKRGSRHEKFLFYILDKFSGVPVNTSVFKYLIKTKNKRKLTLIHKWVPGKGRHHIQINCEKLLMFFEKLLKEKFDEEIFDIFKMCYENLWVSRYIDKICTCASEKRKGILRYFLDIFLKGKSDDDVKLMLFLLKNMRYMYRVREVFVCLVLWRKDIVKEKLLQQVKTDINGFKTEIATCYTLLYYFCHQGKISMIKYIAKAHLNKKSLKPYFMSSKLSGFLIYHMKIHVPDLKKSLVYEIPFENLSIDVIFFVLKEEITQIGFKNIKGLIDSENWKKLDFILDIYIKNRELGVYTLTGYSSMCHSGVVRNIFVGLYELNNEVGNKYCKLLLEKCFQRIRDDFKIVMSKILFKGRKKNRMKVVVNYEILKELRKREDKLSVETDSYFVKRVKEDKRRMEVMSLVCSNKKFIF